jgi:hypothetical protein
VLLTGVDEASKLTICMKANIGPGEAIRVKYVKKRSHGLLVWKHRRRRKRQGPAALRSLRSTLLHFPIQTLFFFPFFLRPPAFSPRDTWRRHLRQINPAPLSHSSVAALPFPWQTPCAQHPAVAALLNASGSEDSHRGPYQAGVG